MSELTEMKENKTPKIKVSLLIHNIMSYTNLPCGIAKEISNYIPPLLCIYRCGGINSKDVMMMNLNEDEKGWINISSTIPGYFSGSAISIIDNRYIIITG